MVLPARKVLVLAYNFPPMGGGGVFRTVKFVTYLPDFGWEPLVFSTDDPLYWARDETLLAEIPRQIVVKRVSPKRPRLLYSLLQKVASERVAHLILDNVFLPDDLIFWAISSALSALPQVRREGISVVYTTSPPHSAHIAGLILKRITGLPWVADFRDPWTGDFGYDPPTRWVRMVHRRCERKILTTADRVICNTETARKRYATDFGIDPRRLVTIYNGFDARDFENRPHKKGRRPERIVITHSGSIYGAYFPDDFFRALGIAIEGDPDLRDRVTVRFVGVMDGSIRKRIEELLSARAVFTGYVSHREALDAVMTSDINLIARPPRKELSYNVPGKLFEYLAAGRPILAAVPRGEAARIVESARAGIVITEDDVGALTARLRRAIRELAERGDLPIDERVVSGFERKRLTGKLARVFDDVTRP